MKLILSVLKALLLVLLGFSANAQAQKTLHSYQLKGKVADSVSGKGLGYITLSLKTGNNPVKSGLTSAEGLFTLSGLKPAAYTLTVAAVNYESRTIRVDLTDSLHQSRDLGTLLIRPRSNSLKEVMITADKPLVKQEADRLTYDLQADPESKVNNVLEMMRKVPLLSVDADDNIKLKGNSNYKILINGKPSGMMERNPKNILRSMPASNIEKIEVITVPPAKYDGEGLAGIINIITSKKIDNGYNGSLNANERFPVGGPGLGGSLTAKSGKLGISANTGGNLYSSPRTANTNSRVTHGENPTSLLQRSMAGTHSSDGYFGTELSFETDSLNLISTQFSINGSRSKNTSSQLSALHNEQALLQQYELENNNNNNGNGIDAALNYQRGFKSNKNRLLTFSYRYFKFVNNQFNDLDVSNQVNYNMPDYQQKNKGFSAEQTFQADYVHPVKNLNIEAGVKGIFRQNNSNYRYLSLNSTSGNFEADPSKSNTYNNNQDVYGIYNSYQYNTKNWGLKAGLRLEQTVVHADFISTATQVDQNYLNLIPSFSANRKFKNMSSLSFGYTRRIQRPGIYRLNPFVDRSNPSFEVSGNPDLRPITGTMLQLNYSRYKKGSVSIGLNYMLVSNLIMPVSVFNPITNITRTTYANTGSGRLIGAEFNLNYPLSKKWNYTLSGRMGYGRIRGSVNGTPTENSGLMGGFFTSSGYRFTDGWRVNASMNYTMPEISLQGKGNSFISSSFSTNRELVKNKLTLSAAVNNPFAKFRTARNTVEGLDFTQQNINQRYMRSFTTSLNYRFGKLKEGIKKNKRGIKNDDVAGAGNDSN